MKLTLLGTSGPLPDPDRHGPSAMLQIGNKYLLFDAGRGVVLQMVRAGIPLKRVNPIFITHHHYDHIGDLADVILTSWLQGRKHPLMIFGPPGTISIVKALLDQVYNKDIEFRSKGELAIGWTPVEATDLMEGLVHDGGNCKVFAEMVIHGHGLGFPSAFKEQWVCMGYRVEAEGKVIAISGDSIDCKGLDRLARDADVLVLCCYLAQAEIIKPSLERLAKDTIACSDTVGKIARQARVKKLVLTHFGQKPGAMMQEIASDVARDYDGPVILGRDLDDVLV
jgi:ribonuclease Z